MELLLKRITKWRRRTAFFRSLNILLFMGVKVLVPIFSAVIAVNLTLSVAGNPFISLNIMIWISIATTVLSGFDTFFNPADKKRKAFLTHNKLANLEERLVLKKGEISSPNNAATIFEDASAELKQILDEYALIGWGS